MTRRESRETAFILCFEKLFTDDTMENIIENAIDGREIEIDEYARKAAITTIEKIDELDKIIERYLKKWSKSRISKVSLCVLRLAVYELVYEKDIPQAAVINEAVDLSKKYSTKEDSSFVNGVLGSVVRDLK